MSVTQRAGSALLVLALVLAGCSASGPPQSATTFELASPGDTPDISLRADAEFREHLGGVTVQLGSDVKLWGEDLLAGDTESALTDARFFLGDFDAELTWLAQHPAAPCYSAAWTGWRGIVAAERAVLDSFVKGKPQAALVKQMNVLSARLASYTFSTSC